MRYPAVHELYVLERAAGGTSGNRHLEHASARGSIRVRSGELARLPAVVVASEQMDEDSGWRALESGELLHVDGGLKATVTTGARSSRPRATDARRPRRPGRELAGIDQVGVSTSLIYRSATGYELLMRALYGRHYADRMRAVADEVPAGSSVLELCCGPATLYRRLPARSRRRLRRDRRQPGVRRGAAPARDRRPRVRPRDRRQRAAERRRGDHPGEPVPLPAATPS